MKEGMIYFVKSEFYEIIRMIGGEWNDNKKRPVVCLFKLKERDDLYWAIPMGDWHHRDQVHKQRIIRYVNLSENDLRSCYYHVGRTTGKSIFLSVMCFRLLINMLRENIWDLMVHHMILRTFC